MNYLTRGTSRCAATGTGARCSTRTRRASSIPRMRRRCRRSCFVVSVSDLYELFDAWYKSLRRDWDWRAVFDKDKKSKLYTEDAKALQEKLLRVERFRSV